MLKGKSNVRLGNRIVGGKGVGIVLAVALAALLLLTACVPTPTVEGKKVEVGHIDPFTGVGSVSVQITEAPMLVP